MRSGLEQPLARGPSPVYPLQVGLKFAFGGMWDCPIKERKIFQSEKHYSRATGQGLWNRIAFTAINSMLSNRSWINKADNTQLWHHDLSENYVCDKEFGFIFNVFAHKNERCVDFVYKTVHWSYHFIMFCDGWNVCSWGRPLLWYILFDYYLTEKNSYSAPFSIALSDFCAASE